MPSSRDSTARCARACQRVAGGFEARSVVALLHAACSSPTARQAMASCTALLMSAWASPPAGSRLATADDLAPLVGALRVECPSLATVEDFLPLDPRFRVSFRAAVGQEGMVFRVHPGGMDSPLHVLQGIVDYAEALDPVLLPGLGFGLADLLLLAGRMLDAEISVLAPAWGDRDVSLNSPPSATQPWLGAVDAAITTARQAAAVAGNNDLRLPEILTNLSNALRSRHAWSGNPADLDAAVETARQAIAVASADHRERARCAHTLASALLACTGRRRTAVTWTRRSTPPGRQRTPRPRATATGPDSCSP